MTYIVMTYIVMVATPIGRAVRHELYSYGLYSYGLYSYGTSKDKATVWPSLKLQSVETVTSAALQSFGST